MKQPSKLMCQPGSLSRGLDKENSEFEPKSRDKLALKLRKVVNSAQNSKHRSLICSVVLMGQGILFWILWMA